MIDYTQITGPEFGLLVKIEDNYFIGRENADAPMRYGMKFKGMEVGMQRLIDRGLARVEGEYFLFDYPKCKEVREAIKNDVKKGLVGEFLKKLVEKTAASQTGSVPADTIYAEFGLDRNLGFSLLSPLIEKKLANYIPEKHASGHYTLVVTEDAKKLVAKGPVHNWFSDLWGHLYDKSSEAAAGGIIALIGFVAGAFFWPKIQSVFTSSTTQPTAIVQEK